MRTFSYLVAVLLLGACASDTDVFLAVDVRTDLVPQVDFVGTRVRLAEGPVLDERLATGLDWQRGVRAAELDLEPGNWQLVVEAIGADGEVRLRREIVVDLSDDLVATVVLTRSCLAVSCGEENTCIDGRCQDPRCTLEAGEFCEAGCTSDDECTAEGECGSVCSDGVCLADVDSCGETHWCHREQGCVERGRPSVVELTIDVVGDGQVRSDAFEEVCQGPGTCTVEVVPGALTLEGEATGDDPVWGWWGTEDCSTPGTYCTTALYEPTWLRFVVGPSVGRLETVPLETEVGKIGQVIAAPDGSVFFSDTENDAIYRATIAGEITRHAGSGVAGFVDGPANEARFSKPSGMALLPDGRLVVADRENNRIRVVDAEGNVSTLAGSGRNEVVDGTGTEASFAEPSLVRSLPGGDLLVREEALERRTRRVSLDGTVTTLAIQPRALAVGPDGDVYWLAGDDLVRAAADAPEDSRTVVSEGPCGFRWGGWGESVAADAEGRLLLLSISLQSSCLIDPDGTERIPLLMTGEGIDGDSPGARLRNAGSIDFGSDGMIFLVDGHSERIRHFTPAE